jgi:chromosome segregation ATPase
VWSSRHTSTTQVETQLTALQQEVDICQLQAMQSALQVLDSKLQQLQQQQAEQGQLLDSQKVSTGASLALLMPLEPRVEQLTGHLGSLAAQVAALHGLVSQQPAHFEVLQSEIEQLSHQLAEVNEAAAEEPDVQLLRERLEALQQQHSQLRADLAADIQAAT